MNNLGPVTRCYGLYLPPPSYECRLCEKWGGSCQHASPLPPVGSDEEAWQMAELLLAGTGYYDTLMTFDTRIRWLKEWKICHQLSEEWCSKEPNKATGLTRAQRYLVATVFYSQRWCSRSSHTGRTCKPTAATHFKHKNTHNCKTHTTI